MRPIRTLVAIADERRLRLFENRGVGKGLVALTEIAFADREGEVPEYADDPGRMTAAPGMGRHAMDPRTPPDEQARQRWARDVAGEIEKVLEADGQQRLIIAAGPKFLGRLRDALGPVAREKLYAELDKDLVEVEERRLVDHFADVAAF